MEVYKFLILLLFTLLLLPAGGVFASDASVQFSEIVWMGMAPKEGESVPAASNNEWIELYNTTGQEINLTGWKITSADGSPNITLSGSIKPQNYFLLERGNDDILPSFKADLVYSFKDNALSNSGEYLFMKDAAGNIIDEINASSGWLAGDNENKNTMQKSGNNWITSPATPKSGWVSATTDSGSSASQTPSATSNGLPQLTIYPSIKVYAGEDKIIIAGSEVEFLGQAWNSKEESLDNGRFWWNFGDGESKEGRVVSHIFQIPGKYTVGLHVSSGSSAASDYALVEVIANQLKISDVLLGENGYFKLYNPSGFTLDIGGWVVESASGKQFIIPAKTKIGSKAEIALANSLTKLFIEDKEPEVKVRYPNGVLALEWKKNAIAIQQPVIENTLNTSQLATNKKHVTSDTSQPTGQMSNVSGQLSAVRTSTTSEIANINEAPLSRQSTLSFWLAGASSLLTAVGYVLISKWKKQKL